MEASGVILRLRRPNMAEQPEKVAL